VLGAEEKSRITLPDGRLIHLELWSGPSVVMVSDELFLAAVDGGVAGHGGDICSRLRRGCAPRSAGGDVSTALEFERR
jgi:hypothetical protein